ncbi:CD209 antigen-like protein C isoform X2 [Perca fluviatilis]|uniref:CD209 antigen-like protein C isoform X2 n=1 Tax=Perca fluviatilis TaxID=8168 RepID=UPI001966AC96|nr:CD209 antigen-like protein C isoform X2 [Perca fluviatilis]
MSEDIYAKPDMSNKVRYNRNVQKDNEWEEREVEIYDDIGDDQTANQSHGGGPDTERNPPAVQRKTLRAAALCLAVLCFLMMTGIILSAYLSVNMSQLKEEVKQLKNRTEEKRCPDGWTILKSSCYFKTNGLNTWSGSRADCRQRGADLVVINDEEEWEFVSELSKDKESWIGLRNINTGQGRGWEWVDGSPLTETFWAAGLTQNNGYYAACCNQQGKWTQGYNYMNKNWMCEKKI